MRTTLASVLAGLSIVAACKDKPAKQAPAPTAPKDAQVVDTAVDTWAICKPALEKAATAPATKRVQMILEACHPCGAWTPLLTWQTLPDKGGPDRRDIEKAMAGCNAWCEPNAKMNFMGALDDARANETRGPWRELGEVCKDKVSATPDGRFMSAPWFALDRIGRWAATQQGAQVVLDAVELVLPPVSLTGAGFVLPEAPVTKPVVAAEHLSVTAAELSVGALPKGKLGASGVTVTGGPYPGDPVAEKDLAARLAKATGPVVLIAPAGLPAARVAVAVKAAGGAPLQLAAKATSGVQGWSAYGVVPISLGTKVDPAGVKLSLGATPDEALQAIKTAGASAFTKAPPTVTVGKDATVTGLASVLGALAYFEVTTVTLKGPTP